MKRAIKKLVLFDIDGTLVRRAGPHHREALVEAVRRTTGLETTTENVPVVGMLDGDIFTQMLLNAGASRAMIRKNMQEMIGHAERHYLRRCPDLRRKVCPGARMLLYRLSRRGGVTTGLVTGNLTRIGWKKMERASLRQYLRFGAFAELANIHWFSRCQFYVDGLSGSVLQTPIQLANQRDPKGRALPHSIRLQINKELPASFRLPNKVPVTEQMVYNVLYNFLNALMNTGVGVCGGKVVRPLAGRTEPQGNRN